MQTDKNKSAVIQVIEHFPTVVSKFRKHETGIEICTENNVLLDVSVVTDHIIRIRYSTTGFFDSDFSYAIDPAFRIGDVAFKTSETDESVILSTSAVTCKITKSGLRTAFYDAAGKLINKDEKGIHWENDPNTGNDIIKMSKEVLDHESYFGLGDKPTELNIRGKRFQNWGTDSYGYDKDWDPLYKNIPFYYGLHHNIGYGIFFDNSFRTHFDFACERPDATSFWAPGGEMNYYFIAGPELLDVAVRYSDLTGRTELPAMWTLGFQQCKWSYFPESQVRDITTKMREYRVPCDAIYLDIDYMDGFRCFTWNDERFPDPKKMIADLKEQGYKTVVIIDPGIKKDPDYHVFQDALEKGYFCRRPDGPYVEGLVWPGECYFPDFTRPEVRYWWGDLYKELIADYKVAGVWNDMNEPALFEVEGNTFPEDVRHDYDGHPCSHRKAHNVYGMQMARATYEGVKKHTDDKRGLIITRSGYSGLQRYTSVWTGDNLSTWRHIWLANVQCQRLSISGVPFSGSDIGGFVGKPTPEMFVRWIQLGIFHTFCRVHSSQDDGDQEPWSFGETALNHFREAVELRYRMLPYHYTAFYQYTKTGVPILKPLSFYDQTDTKTLYRNNEFICGDHILTSSINEPDQASTPVYLPKGRWYNYWNQDVLEGGNSIDFPLTLDTFPLFIKEGAIIPLYPVQQYVDADSFDTVTLDVYYKEGIEKSHLYEDRHDGYSYRDGEFKDSEFTLTGSPDRLIITQECTGNFTPGYDCFKLNLIGLPFEVKHVEVDGQKAQSSDLSIPVSFQKIVLQG